MIAHPATRGYAIIYDRLKPPACPGCARSQWLVGRVTAECAFCATAVPLKEAA